jgi:hypothetical protein
MTLKMSFINCGFCCSGLFYCKRKFSRRQGKWRWDATAEFAKKKHVTHSPFFFAQSVVSGWHPKNFFMKSLVPQYCPHFLKQQATAQYFRHANELFFFRYCLYGGRWLTYEILHEGAAQKYHTYIHTYVHTYINAYSYICHRLLFSNYKSVRTRISNIISIHKCKMYKQSTINEEILQRSTVMKQ